MFVKILDQNGTHRTEADRQDERLLVECEVLRTWFAHYPETVHPDQTIEVPFNEPHPGTILVVRADDRELWLQDAVVFVMNDDGKTIDRLVV
jgi:hypothetical protein